MARKEDMSNDGSKLNDSGVFTLNDTSVGRYGENKKKTDIQLVQFFLRQFYKRHREIFVHLPQTRSGDGMIAIDGKYGRQTELGILHFQKYIQKHGIGIKADALVSAAHSLRGPQTDNIYTIHRLNTFFRTHGEYKEHHGKLEGHPDIIALAPELRAELLAATVRNDF